MVSSLLVTVLSLPDLGNTTCINRELENLNFLQCVGQLSWPKCQLYLVEKHYKEECRNSGEKRGSV